MKLRKYIDYCFPTSARADQLGGAGYYIAQEILREDSTWSPAFIAQGCHTPGMDIDDPDLMSLLHEAGGEHYIPYCHSNRYRQAKI